MKKKAVKPAPKKSMGRRLKYGEATVKVNYRIPVSKKQEIDKLFADFAEQWATAK